MFLVYVLYSKDFDRFYTGMTNNKQLRLKEHNNKQNKSTKAYSPWIVIYEETFKERKEARKREKYLKSGIGREFIKRIMAT